MVILTSTSIPVPLLQNSTIFARVDVKFPLFDESTTTANGTAPTEGYNLFTLDDVVTSCYVSGPSGPPII